MAKKKKKFNYISLNKYMFNSTGHLVNLFRNRQFEHLFWKSNKNNQPTSFLTDLLQY